ncbi:MAG: carboxypeptidase regulatory-like domain-containing protein [Acidobacteriota bacterium]
MTLRSVIALFALVFPLPAQETRATITGQIKDASGSSVPNAQITIGNTETGVATRIRSNDAGSFEAPFLVQGAYELTAEAAGFKTYRRSGITLLLGARVDLSIRLEVGDAASAITVTEEAPLLNTLGGSSAQVMNNKAVMDLPTLSNSLILQAGLNAGMQKLNFGNPNLSFTNASSSHGATGAVGGNEWSIDGSPNSGQFRRAAYLPITDAIQEMRVESITFDATVGHSTGAYVMMTTKSGTNDYHGTLTNTHWQQRWNATASTDSGVYWGRIRAAELAGNTALANELRAQPRQPSGRSNTYSGALGGPVRIPKLYNGKNKLFFFFIYSGQTERFFDLETARKIYTVPTAEERRGDFSRLLRLNAARYQIYDPMTTRLNPATGLFVRDAIPGNQVPLSRVANPKMYDFYSKVYPLPNNPAIADLDGNNNLFSDPLVKYDYFALQNRVDWNATARDRFFFRWSYNKFSNDRQDWSYSTFPGLHSEALRRNNIGGSIDYVHTFSASTLLNINLSYNRYWDNRPLNEVQWSYKPTQVGLPEYLDQKAGNQNTLPSIAFSNYRQISNPRVALLPTSIGSLRVQLSKYIGRHSMTLGFDPRMYYSLGGDSGLSYPGYTSGLFRFNNDLMRQTSAAVGVGTLGTEWAAFMLGVPSVVQVDTNDSYYGTTPRQGYYFQDNWRVNSRLSVNLGMRLEHEGGIVERFNRGLRGFDPSANLAISEAVQAAYARAPLAEVSPANFRVAGAPDYLGKNAPRTLTNSTTRIMPRFGFAYQLTANTVLRGGFGVYYDTLNTTHTFPNQFGYNRATLTNITDEAGATWNHGFFAAPTNNPLTNPFPVRADGTRFDLPAGNTLGGNSLLGRGYDFIGTSFSPAQANKMRLELERLLWKDMLLGVSYNWGYVPNLGVRRDLNALPQPYWATGNSRNAAVDAELNRNVTNPFRLTNLTGLRTANPALYNDLSTLALFTSPVIRKNQLLRPFPQYTALTQSLEPIGENKVNSLIVRLERRFRNGFLFNTHYEWAHTMSRDWFANAYDTKPIWRESDGSRPHRWVVTSIYELPFGAGKPWLREGWAKRLAGGWQIGVTSQRQSGECIDFGNVFFLGTNYRDIVLPPSERTQDRWFRTELFERSPARVPGTFHARAFPNRMNWLRTETLLQLDANILKNFQITEHIKMSLRGDLINAPNKQVLGNPSVNPLDTNFGRVSQFASTPRLLQFTFRMTF